MQKIIISLVFSILVILLVACQGEQKVETTVEEQVTTMVSDTTQVTCPACDMTHSASEMTAYEVEGETHYFCSDACKDHYLADLESSADESTTDE